jgi:aminotransferase EvaB
MRIPINDLKRHHHGLDQKLSDAVSRVLGRGWFILGPEVEAFETEFASFCGTSDAIGVASGTDALELAIRAAGVRPGAEVATAANAGMYGTTAILLAGARPLFVDVDPGTMNMDPAALRKAISAETAAVIVTHLYGKLAPVEELAAVAAEHGVPVIEDCAHSHGAERNGRRSGSFGALGCFSFYPTKNLGAAGDAGAIVTSDAELAGRVRKLRQYGWTGKYRSDMDGGRNSRLDEIQAAVLREKLPFLQGWNARRREIACAYNRAFAGTGLLLPGDPGNLDYVGHLYVIRSAERARIRAALEGAGIGTDIHFPLPDHLQESLRGVDFRRTPLPVTEACAEEVLTLPCFPEMTDDEVACVQRSVLEAVKPGVEREVPC